MAGYQKLSVLLGEEMQQLIEEGREFDFDMLKAEIEAAGDDREKLMSIYKRMENFPVRSDFKYIEPTEYDEIQKYCTLNNTVKPVKEDELYDRVYGAWLARCGGCALGQPIELWTREGIKNWCVKADAWPIDNYMPAHSKAEEDGVHLNNDYATRDNMKHMPTDDDIRYTVLGLKLLREKGDKFDIWDAGANWIYNLPFRWLCTAENQAYLNFINIDENGPWGKPEGADELIKKNGVNTYLNPYREWIGAQIRIDAYGYGCAGDPHRAAKAAFTDAYFSHTKNGIYGAMFFAALIACAFVEKDINKAIENAKAEIPKTSRLYEAIENAVEIGKSSKTLDEMLDRVLDAYKNYNYVHTINNTALCVAALVFGKGDFEKTLTATASGGMDTDCTCATVGSVIGAFNGEKKIPEKWKKPLGDSLYSGLADYHPINISTLAKQTCEVYKKLAAENN